MSSSRDRTSLLALALILIFGGRLRFQQIASSSLWLDEILNVEIIRKLGELPAYAWLLGFERENGPVYFALHAVSLALFEPVELAMRVPSAISGMAAIVLAFLVARRASGRMSAGVVAALVIAVSPFHVYYSIEGRPYALLVLLMLAALYLLLDPGGPPRTWLAIVLLAAALTAATSVPILGTVALVATVMTWKSRETPTLKRWRTALLLALAAIAYALFLYARFEQPAPVAGFDGTLPSLGSVILNGFTLTPGHVHELQPSAIAAAGLAVCGFALLWNRRRAVIIGTAVIAPLAISIAALAARDHWFSLRYAIHALAPFLVLVACGITEIAERLSQIVLRGTTRFVEIRGAAHQDRLACGGPEPSASRGWSPDPLLGSVVGISLVVILTLALVLPVLETARSATSSRPDWKRIATVLARHARPGDLVATQSPWSETSIRFYLNELGADLDVRNVRGSVEIARYLVERRPRAWIVVGGFEPGPSIRGWACQYLALARDDDEEIRLYYAPGLPDFIHARATDQDRRRFMGSLDAAGGIRLEMERWDDPYLGDGWYGPETSGSERFRWSRGESSVLLPVPAERSLLRFRASPIAPGQSLTVFVDGDQVETIDMRSDAFEYQLGLNELAGPMVELGFHFSQEIAPASLGESGDVRPLSAAFDWIELTDSVSKTSSRPPLFQVSDATDHDTEVPACDVAAELTSSARSRMLGQLGRSDAPASANLTRIVVDSLPPSECLSDREFVDMLFVTLLGRHVDSVGATYYTAALAGEFTRPEVVCLVMGSEEFQQMYETER